MALQSAEKYNQHQHVRNFSPPTMFRLIHTRIVYMRTYVVYICMLLVNQWFMILRLGMSAFKRLLRPLREPSQAQTSV